MEIGESIAIPVPTSDTEEKPRIVSAIIVHGEGKTVGGGKQFVNLPRDAKWVDNTRVHDEERLGRKLRIKVTFNKPGAHSFKLKLEPGSSNAQYTGGEKGRNENFKYQDTEKSYTTESDGSKIVEEDFFVAIAGNDSYHPVGTDADGNEARGGAISTQRLAYYVELKMKGLSAVARNLAGLVGEFTKHRIEFVGLPAVEMDHMPNISNATADNNDFKTKARAAYNGSEGPGKAPYVIAVAYTDHLAVKDADRKLTLADVETGPGKADVQIPIVDASKTPPATKYLWHDLVPGEDWFISASFLADGATAGTDDVTIAKADCTPLPRSPSSPDMWSKVKIKVSGLPEAKGTITLKVNWVNRMRGGISLSGNIVCVCTRAWWKNKSTGDQNQTMIHEIGHQLNMVADGTGKGPDRVSTQYSGKGHVGSHCHHSLPVQADYGSASGSCVMFGATNGISAFCSNCAPAVLKQDLSAGWTAF
ncbi:hypothetical protein [Povalibacter sp.]|uniref:hypothetical protein n=1 Tax=Povalibacter sp. TaxID=1962978 RepID=UPI002F3F1FA8